jgi:hypothetical protein
MKIFSQAYNLVCLIILIVTVLVCTSCQSDNYIRVTEYDGAALPIPGVNAAAGGCQVSQQGTVDASITYDGTSCTVTTGTTPADDTPPTPQSEERF